MSEDIDKRIERAIRSVASKKAEMDRWEEEWKERARRRGIHAAAALAKRADVACTVIPAAMRVAKPSAKPGRKLWRRPFFWISTGAAVMLILIAGISFTWFSDNAPEKNTYDMVPRDRNSSHSPLGSSETPVEAAAPDELEYDQAEPVAEAPPEAAPAESEPAVVFRGGSTDFSEIVGLMESGKPDKALILIDEALADTVIDPDMTPDRIEYQRGLIADQRYELLWLKINALYESGRHAEAVDLLKTYCRTEGEHQKEAKALLKKIKK